MINLPEADYLSLTENVTDWRLGRRAVINRPALTLGWGCLTLTLLPSVLILILGIVLSIQNDDVANLISAGMLALIVFGGVYMLILRPFYHDSWEREFVFDWEQDSVSVRIGRRVTVFEFSEIEAFRVRTRPEAPPTDSERSAASNSDSADDDTPEYFGLIEMDVQGKSFVLFETLYANAVPDEPCRIVATLARRMAELFSVPCEFSVAGRIPSEEEINSWCRTNGEIAGNYVDLGVSASGHLMSAEYRGKSDEAEEWREEALFHFLEAARLDPENSQALLEMGRVSQEHGAAAVEAALARNPDDPQPRLQQAQLLAVSGDFEGALSVYEDVIVQHPSAQAYSARGNLQMMLNRYHPAIDDFSAALQIEPDEARLYAQRAECWRSWYRRSRQPQHLNEALLDFEQAIGLEPDNDTVQISRCRLLIDADRSEEAISELSRVIDADPESFDAYSARGQAYLATGTSPESAVRDLTRSIMLLEQQPTPAGSEFQSTMAIAVSAAYRWRAESYKQMGKLAEADHDRRHADELVGESLID